MHGKQKRLVTRRQTLFYESRQDSKETEVKQRALVGAWGVSLMTLPVEICRAASACVIRGPVSHRGRERAHSTSFEPF